eukprot:756975-Hanusia_phi.AAC.1
MGVGRDQRNRGGRGDSEGESCASIDLSRVGHSKRLPAALRRTPGLARRRDTLSDSAHLAYYISDAATQ